jgi:hypothetical protein
MAYIDWAYFQAYAPGSSVTATEFPALAERASDVIDMLTFCRIKEAGGLSALPSSIQDAVKKATAAQVETLGLFGGAMATAGAAVNPNSATIGKFSYSRSEWSGGSINGIPLSPLVSGYLGCTGLMYAGIDRGC